MLRLTLTLALLFPTAALAASGSIGGRIAAAGKPLANVTVSASTESAPKPFVTVTAANGAYALPALPAATYDVTFSLAGYQTLTRRAEVRAHERARVDAELEVSEEGEAVTQTAMTRDVHERPQAAWTLDRALAEALPIGRGVGARADLAPSARFRRVQLDGFPTFDSGPAPEAVAQTTVVFAGGVRDDLLEITTRGERAFGATLRETLTWRDGDRSELHEASVGGLWMFAAGAARDDLRFGFGKASFAPTARDTATLTFQGSNLPGAETLRGTWLHVSRNVSAIAHATRDVAVLRAYTFAAGAHELGGGIERIDDEWSGFVRDRWSVSDRAIVEGGLRFDDDELLPHVGVVFGGATRFIGNYTRDEASIGVAQRLASNGYARGMLIRRDGETFGTIDGALTWLLFTFGATGSFGDGTHANAWVLIDPPLPGHDLTLAILERYRGGAFTDLAINYAWPRERFAPFVEAEVVNVFDRNDGRLFRLSAGLRVF